MKTMPKKTFPRKRLISYLVNCPFGLRLKTGKSQKKKKKSVTDVSTFKHMPLTGFKI